MSATGNIVSTSVSEAPSHNDPSADRATPAASVAQTGGAENMPGASKAEARGHTESESRTVGERMFAELTQPDFERLAFEIGQRFGHSSLHCVAFLELTEQGPRTEKLREAIVKAYDTFSELERALSMLGRPILAQACRVAREGCAQALELRPDEVTR